MEPLYVVAGDRVVAEPAALRLGAAIAERGGHEVEIVRRPAGLAALLGSLRTLSLFATGRTIVVVESAVLADRAAAADLLDEAGEVEPPEAGAGLALEERRAVGRLLQALRLFGAEPDAGSVETAVDALPAWALQGGRIWRSAHANRPRGAAQSRQLRDRLVRLLAAARAAELRGWAEGDLEELGELARGGFPPAHTLVLAESAVAGEHPLVRWLAERGAFVDLGRVATRGDAWQGLDSIVAALAAETGVGIEPDAVTELARRTLQAEDSRGRSGEPRSIRADSTARFAAEYRKLASLSGGAAVERPLVEATVADRGDENVWELLDAIGRGAMGEALRRVGRTLEAAEDPVAARLSLFALLAEFARQLTAVAGLARAAGVPRGETNYPRFKERLAPRLQAARPYGAPSPLQGVHAYRLHRVYLAASRRPADRVARLPWHVLQAELLLKGGSRSPDVVISELVTELAR